MWLARISVIPAEPHFAARAGTQSHKRHSPNFVKSSHRSRHCGFVCSISWSFQSRRQRLMRFSLVIASRIS